MAGAVGMYVRTMPPTPDGPDGAPGEYSSTENRPLAGYVGLIGLYSLTVGALALAVRRRRQPLGRMGPYDLVLAAVATHKLSRLITKDSITSPLRAPVVRYVEPAGGGEVNEEVRVDGALHALGELAVCPICLDVWIATALVGGLALAPRASRLVASILSVTAASNALHYGWDALKKTEQ